MGEEREMLWLAAKRVGLFDCYRVKVDRGPKTQPLSWRWLVRSTTMQGDFQLQTTLTFSLSQDHLGSYWTQLISFVLSTHCIASYIFIFVRRKLNTSFQSILIE